MTTPPSVHHPVAIVGGGLGGLVLARVLHLGGVRAAVYELDASPTARTQGGMLDLHEDSGQAALRAAGLHQEFLAAVHPGGQAVRVLDRHATELLAQSDENISGGRPEISRQELRALLLASLPKGTVRWGSKVTGVRPLGAGRHEVALGSGATFTTDLLVGADGAWSTVRPLLSAARPGYSGVSFVEAHLLDADARHPQSAAVVGGGMLFALAPGRGFLAHRDSGGGLHVYCALTVPADWTTAGGVDFTDPRAAKARLLSHFEDWHPSLRALIADAEGPLVPRAVHALPVGHRWDRVPGVTLLGDAAHLMSPFAGEGANLALLDGAELAAALLAHPDDRETALRRYEEAMFARAEESAALSAAGLDACFGARAPYGLVDQFTAHRTAGG